MSGMQPSSPLSPSLPPFCSSSVSPSLQLSVLKTLTSYTSRTLFLPLLSSSWLPVDSVSQRISAEDSFHITEKLGCCLLNFPRIRRSSCFSHFLWHIILTISPSACFLYFLLACLNIEICLLVALLHVADESSPFAFFCVFVCDLG